MSSRGAGSRRQECPASSLETCWCTDIHTSHAEVADSSAPVGHGGAAPSRYRCTLPGPLLPLRGQDLRHRQGRLPLYGDGVLILRPLLGRAPGVEVVLMLPLFSIATTGRRTPLLLASSVRLKKSLYKPCGPLILVVDLIQSGTSYPAHLGRLPVMSISAQTLRKVLITQSSSSWYSVQSLRDHLFSLRVSNTSPAKLVTCVAW